MEEDYLKSIVYSPAVVEFVTVAVRFCAYLENLESEDKVEFTATTIKLLPLLYIKATLLPDNEPVLEEEVETYVDEETYALITGKIATVLKDSDTYLEVFLQDMKYSETPISAFISEDLADIYQDVKDFACVYETGMTENMNDALYTCNEHFKSYWGQKLVNVLRALHSVHYDSSLNSEEDIYSNETDNEEAIW
jgi:Domain of unknown function (DUF5063)